MSVLDYTKELTLFDEYDIKSIEMMVDYLKLKQKKEFSFLNQISLKDVQLYWYTDSNKNVLGGFHMFSFNVIYINQTNGIGKKEWIYINKMQKIISCFPIILHQLCHYWQFNKNPVLYFFLQFPFVRDYTIEKQADKIEDYLYENNKFMSMTIKKIAQIKKEYNFYQNEFDEKEKQYLFS